MENEHEFNNNKNKNNSGAAREAGAAANLAAQKYGDIEHRYVYEPTATETLGVLSASSRQLMSVLGRRIAQVSGEARETSFLFQRCSVPVQRFNAVLLPVIDCTV